MLLLVYDFNSMLLKFHSPLYPQLCWLTCSLFILSVSSILSIISHTRCQIVFVFQRDIDERRSGQLAKHITYNIMKMYVYNLYINRMLICPDNLPMRMRVSLSGIIRFSVSKRWWAYKFRCLGGSFVSSYGGNFYVSDVLVECTTIIYAAIIY